MTLWDGLSLEETNTLQTIFWSPGMSRFALADRLGYSKSKANSLVASLLDVGLLKETGLQGSTGGRRPETVQLSERLGTGTLQIGAPADLSLLELVDGPVEFVDTRNNKRMGRQFLKPAGTIVAGVAFGRPYQSPFSVR